MKNLTRFRTFFVKKIVLILILLPFFAHANNSLNSFYLDPISSSVSLSPNGKKLLGIRNSQGKSVVFVYDIANKTSFYPLSTDNKRFKIKHVYWGNDNRVLISVIHPSTHKTVVYDETRLIVKDASVKSKMLNLYKPKANSDGYVWISQYQDNVICQKSDEPDYVWIAIDKDVPVAPSVYKININSGRGSLVMSAKDHVIDWITDNECNPRVSLHYNERSNKRYYRYLNANNVWVDGWTIDTNNDEVLSVLGFGKNPNQLYVFAKRNNERNALFLMDLSEPSLPKKLVASYPNNVSVTSLFYSKKLRDVVGVYLDNGNTNFWHKDYVNLKNDVAKLLPGMKAKIVSLSDDENNYLVYAESPVQTALVFLGNRKNKTLDVAVENHPEIDAAMIHSRNKISLPFGDDKITAYISLPKKSDKILPAIFIYGSSALGYAKWRFDFFTQYLVNDGYAVIEIPNPKREFSVIAKDLLSDQNNLKYLRDYLVENNVIDGKKVCLLGRNYFANGLILHADKYSNDYACVIGLNGLYDGPFAYRRADSFYMTESIRQSIGGDANTLKSYSAAHVVSKNKQPLLIINAVNTILSPIVQAKSFTENLRKANGQVIFVEVPDAKQLGDSESSRKIVFESVKEFLDSTLQ